MFNLVSLIALRLRLTRWLRDTDSEFFHELREVTVIDVTREEWLLEVCRGRRVLHLGFADAPFTQARITSGELLHLRIRAVAAHTRGLDVDAEAVDAYKRLTGDANVGSMDLGQRPISDVVGGPWDVVLLGEALEHLRDPGHSLQNVRTICEMSGHAQLCVTVPNAFAVTGFFAALEGHEIVHPEHYYYFSPVTLTRLLIDSGFQEIRCFIGGPRRLRRAPGITRPSLMALCLPQASRPGSSPR